jgi:hypothetical protein
MTTCTDSIDKASCLKCQAQLQEAQQKLAEAQRKIDDLNQHRFSAYQNGYRTWRFDSATGKTCILLTSEADWKRTDTKQQSCECKDLLSDVAHNSSAEEYWKNVKGPRVIAVCGE